MPYPFGVLIADRPISFASLHIEFDAGARGTITMGEYYTYAGVASSTSTISMSQFWNKSRASLVAGSMSFAGKNNSVGTYSGYDVSGVNYSAIWRVANAGGVGGAAVDSSGRLWAWGGSIIYNYTSGFTGRGTTAVTYTPGQVGTLTTWKYATVVAPQYSDGNMLAIRTDNTLWISGGGTNGEVGNATKINRSSPTQCPGAWLHATTNGEGTVMGIKTDGTLWSWGETGAGSFWQGGLGAIGYVYSVSTPVQVGGTAWKYIALNAYQGSGIKTDGSLWCWGEGNSGPAPPTGAWTHLTSPIQATGYDWWRIGVGMWHGAGIKTDGRLFTWGRNDACLGRGTPAGYWQSPAEVSVGGAWKMVVCGYEYTVAINVDGSLWYAGYDIIRPANNVTTYTMTQVNTSNWKWIGGDGPQTSTAYAMLAIV